MFKTFQKLSLIIILFSNQFTSHASSNIDAFDIPALSTSQRQILSPEVMEVIEDVYKYGKDTLDLRAMEIGDKEVCALLAENIRIATVMRFFLSDNKIGDEGAKALAQRSTITWLDLDNNKVSDVGAAALSLNLTIIHLRLIKNNIGDEGARSLSQNTTIRELYLGDNNIGDDGAISLAQNSTFSALFLDGHKIGKDGARALIYSQIKSVALSSTKSILSKQFINAQNKNAGRNKDGELEKN